MMLHLSGFKQTVASCLYFRQLSFMHGGLCIAASQLLVILGGTHPSAVMRHMLIRMIVKLQPMVTILQMKFTELAAEEHYEKNCSWHAVERDNLWGHWDARVKCIRQVLHIDTYILFEQPSLAPKFPHSP